MISSKRLFEIGELEGASKATGNSPISNRKIILDIPDNEVSMHNKRRSFSKQYKLRILRELDECTNPKQIGAILRREGLYSSNVTYWRKQMEQGKLNKKISDKFQKKITELLRQNKKLQRKLNQAKLIIDAQKKISEILELTDLS